MAFKHRVHELVRNQPASVSGSLVCNSLFYIKEAISLTCYIQVKNMNEILACVMIDLIDETKVWSFDAGRISEHSENLVDDEIYICM